MKCPVCKNEMIILELEQVEIDHCGSCGGIWLDHGELEILLEGNEAKRELLDSMKEVTGTGEKVRRCPRCRKRMLKVLTGAKGETLIDKCKNNHGLWFDRGELHQIVNSGSLDPGNKIAHLLNEMFRYPLNQ